MHQRFEIVARIPIIATRDVLYEIVGESKRSYRCLTCVLKIVWQLHEIGDNKSACAQEHDKRKQANNALEEKMSIAKRPIAIVSPNHTLSGEETANYQEYLHTQIAILKQSQMIQYYCKYGQALKQVKQKKSLWHTIFMIFFCFNILEIMLQIN